MSTPPPCPRVAPAGDAAVLVTLGERIDPALNARVHALAEALRPLPWVDDAIPGYASLLLEYDPLAVSYAEVEAAVHAALDALPAAPRREGRLRQVPTVYGGEYGPDLEAVAARVGLAPEEVVRLHAGTVQRVYFLGFAPGHPYMGDLPPVLALPRLPTPRTAVPAGAVAIAGGQTVIYPFSFPGGWHILGRTPLRLFDPEREPPAYFQPGDRVQFVPIPPTAWSDYVEPAAPSARPPVTDAALTVEAGGLLTLVQDGGRVGYGHLGVPRSGPMDWAALRAANLLVGNAPGAAGLEINLVGPTLRFHRDALLAVTGGDLRPTLDGEPLPLWAAWYARAGQVLRFGPRRAGLRAYLALAGGIAVPPVLGSRATYVRAGLGGLAGRALQAGDRLALAPPSPDPRCQLGCYLPPEHRPPYSAAPEVRVLLGPHADRFSDETIDTFLSATYTVSPASDRMGYRLAGPRLARREPADLVSGGMPLGGVQVPGDGQPIVLLSDHQPTGGYPLLATVIQADLPLVAQLAPGDTVRFRAVSLAEARAAYRARLAATAALARRALLLVPAEE
ncbi:MAG TPA: 5-oxoprolinase subunit PxpB [Chloroflexota bacterium]|nr:5-oxoprolinase subunit PxpB [Chloroflexota bacterium]